MSESSSHAQPQYDHTPIDELVLGVWFRQIDQLIVPYWGVLWEKYKPEYPLCQQHLRLDPLITEPPRELPIDSPRVWFVHDGGNQLIQAQSDAFFFNWRRQKLEDIYPRFPVLFKEFKNHFSVFQAFVKENLREVVEPIAYDLSYINAIPITEEQDHIAEFGRYFPDFRWREGRPGVLSKLIGANWQTHFKLPNDVGMLRISIVNARRKSDQQSVIRLDINVRGIFKNQGIDGIEFWFDQAHKSTIQAFSYFTSKEVQREKWGLQE